jgi:hypothetical protein
MHESVDISQFAGQKVSLRFEYLTDPAVNGEGFLIDDVSIPALNYSTDFETDEGGWQAAGFIRIENTIPQTFRLALITRTSGGTTVQIIPISTSQSADIPLNLGDNKAENAVLVITATNRFTRILAPYKFYIK